MFKYFFIILVLSIAILMLLLQHNQDVLYLSEEIISDNAVEHSLLQDRDRIQTIRANVDMRYMGLNLSSALYYEKPRSFRMIISSRFAKEIDIGSSNIYFWFYSRRMRPEALYFARHDDHHRTRLRTPFDPNWIIECLNLEPINDTMYPHGEYLITKEYFVNNLGIRVYRIRLIDPKINAVIGNYIYDLDGNVIVSSEVVEFQNVEGFQLPKRVRIYWAEENVILNWEYSNIIINEALSPKLWVVPHHRNRINMAQM